jgi:hypothetical protein
MVTVPVKEHIAVRRGKQAAQQRRLGPVHRP